MSKPSLLKQLYRTIPAPIRDSVPVRRARTFLQSRVLPHDWVYDSTYYSQESRGASVQSAPALAASIARDLRPRRVIDVGCGTGDTLIALGDLGCEVFGLERSAAALAVCRSRGLPVRQFDLEHDDSAGMGEFDAVLSMEVAEHLPEAVADRYVDLLTGLGRTIVFTAARPGQGGTDHVNEQPPEYWHAKFRERSFHLDRTTSDRWREEWKASGAVASWYHENLMVFHRKPAPSS